MKRYAVISAKRDTPEVIARYLPVNYKIVAEVESPDEFPFDGRCVVIQGEDRAGWTMHEYVLPRLGSGMIVGKEIDLSHPVMKKVPLLSFIRHFDEENSN